MRGHGRQLVQDAPRFPRPAQRRMNIDQTYFGVSLRMCPNSPLVQGPLAAFARLTVIQTHMPPYALVSDVPGLTALIWLISLGATRCCLFLSCSYSHHCLDSEAIVLAYANGPTLVLTLT